MKNNGHNLYFYYFLFLALITLNVLPSAFAISQCKLSMTVSYAPVQQLSIADVDFENFESRNLLFTLSIKNDTTVTISAILQIKLSIKLADQTLLPDPGLTFTSKEFEVPVEGLIITNLEIGKNTKIKTSEYNLENEVKNKVQDVALATGKFPAGIYIFNIILTPINCGKVVSEPVILTIQNPSRVELRSPRDGEVTNEFPLFEFFSDCNKVELTVAKKSSDQSREEAISHEPPMDRKDLIGQNSFLYSGGRPLEQGKTYVWKVVGKILGPGGTEIEVPSPIGLFKVSSSEQAGPEDALLKILEEMFGSRYPAIFEQIHNGDFNLTGMNTLNGAVISRGDLLRLLNELRQINDNVELSFE